MRQTNYLKLFSIFAFLVFGGVSCWATAESLHLLLATWPKIFCYLVAIGFFVVAAIGTKLIVDSLNQKIYCEGRTGKLIAGILLVLIFWLAASMPTNTHTFIYRNVISERVNNDISVTQGYLADINENANEVERIKTLMRQEQDSVRKYQMALINEVMQPNDPGSGPDAKRIIQQLESRYGYKIHEFKMKGYSKKDLSFAIDYYNNQFAEIIENIIPQKFNDMMTSPNETNKALAKTAYDELQKLKDNIDASMNSKNKIVDLNSAEDIHNKVIAKLNDGYQAVKSNSDLVNFKGNDAQRYKADPIVTETQRMTSIFEVWGDYLSGKFSGHGFFWWIILAILVDVAAFIFFDIAFKK